MKPRRAGSQAGGQVRGRAIVALVAGALVLLVAGGAAQAADPSALWHIVHDRCVPNELRHDDPVPCTLVDLSHGYVVLKDRVGVTQFLVLPTARIPGIESPLLLAPGAPDYLQDAWAARHFVAARAPAPLTRADLSLAVNSVFGRSQNQLHIHVDCLRPEVRAALTRHLADIGGKWRPFPVPLAGHSYIARRLMRPDLAGINPFLLLAEASPEVAAHMGDYTLVVAGASFAGKTGFVLVADRADPTHGDFGNGESLQDHSCALARH